MAISIDFQRAASFRSLPTNGRMTAWLEHAISHKRKRASLAVRFVDEPEGAELNQRWRGKAGPTNVLSFPASGLDRVAPEVLGDLVLCVPVLKVEARAQRKTIAAHCAHLLVHGALHLLGYDHEADKPAERMERLERKLLAELGFPDPYAERDPGP